MPTNLPAEWSKYYEKYQKAKTAKEKVEALREVIAHTPKNKATDKIRAKYKRKISELKKEVIKDRKKEAGRKSLSVSKEGDAQVSILGTANSGKSTFLKKMTNAEPKIANYPFTTSEPEVGMLEFEGVKIQMVEIPSTFTPEIISVARTSDMILAFIGKNFKKDRQKRKVMGIIKKENLKNPIFVRWDMTKKDLFEKIWKRLNMMRVYTKDPGKKPDKPVVIEKKSTVEDVCGRLHKDFLKYFKFAKITGPSADFDEQRVGIEHELMDGDIVEIHLKK